MGAAVLSTELQLFNPLSLPSSLWLKADGVLWQDTARTVPAVANSDPVGCWDDSSGNSNHAIQATAGSRPLLKLASQNGLPALLFDGTDDFLALSGNGLNLVRNVPSLSVLLVWQLSIGQGNTRPWAASNSIATNQTRAALVYNLASSPNNLSSVTRRLDADAASILNQVDNGFTLGAYHSSALVFNFAGAAGSLYLDGRVVTGGSTGVQGNTENTASVSITIGAGNLTSNQINGSIGELVISQSAMTPAQIAAWTTYCRQKWGTP